MEEWSSKRGLEGVPSTGIFQQISTLLVLGVGPNYSNILFISASDDRQLKWNLCNKRPNDEKIGTPETTRMSIVRCSIRTPEESLSRFFN
jgi:hypothetical protein